MKCVECSLQIAADKAPHIRKCITCGRQLVPTAKDVLEYNAFNLVKEVRHEQVRMAADIEKLLSTGKGTLLAEGGTGLGKSYAYAVPVLTQLIEVSVTKKATPLRVVFSTAKKSLQSQLYHDLPRLNTALDANADVVLYKGQNNYACWKLASSVPEHERAFFQEFIARARDAGVPADLANWPGVRPLWWDAVSLENCPLGTKCECYAVCRPHVQTSNIIITNHHLVGIDLTLARPGWLFGPYSFLVVDEAHHFLQAVRGLLSNTLTPESIDKAARNIKNDARLQQYVLETTNVAPITEIAASITAARDDILNLISSAAQKCDSAKRYRPQEFSPAIDIAQSAVDRALKLLTPVHDNLNRDYEIVKSGGGDDDDNPDYYLALLNKTARIIKPLTIAKNFLSKHLNQDLIQNYITVATNEPNDVSLYMTPLEIGPILNPLLGHVSHKVFVSATLSLNGDFTYFKEDLGIEPEAVGKIYQSPYDVQKNVVLYLPPWDMPLPAHSFSPDRREWITAISEEILQLCRMTGGGTFVLFSAEKDMSDVEAYVNYPLASSGLRLLVQRGEITQYVREFKQTPNAILFGMKSLWEGIDVVGDQLRCVIIPKLPFPNPNDPLIASRSERATANGDNAFTRVSLPAMFTDMRQGVGRLIRSATDRGVVAILDARVWTGSTGNHAKRLEKVKADPQNRRLGYGKDLLDILGFTTLTNDFTRLERWYRKTFKSLNTVNTVKEGETENGTS